MIDGKPRILIVRLSAIGDVVRVLPALHVLREAHPDARIDWAVERKSADIVLGHPALDETLIFDRPRGLAQSFRSFAAFCRTVRKNRYDVVIDFHGLFKTGLIAASSGASQRYGFARPRAQEGSFLFTNRKVRLVNPRMNRVEENLALIEGRAPNYRWPNITLYVPSSVQEEVDAFFDSTFESGKLVVAMHVPVDRAEKRWPDAHFAALADMLLADGRFEVMLTWGPGQFEALESVLRHAHRHPVIAPETPTLKHYAWLAHRSAAYVGGDTGPMHIAAAMGTPVVAIFGDTDPAKHAPCRLPHIVLHNDAPGIGAAERLASITPEMAYDACLDLLFGVKPDGPR